jgi:hypothetical protein
MVLVADNVDLNVLHAHDRLDNSDRLAGIIENRALLDVRLDIR